MWEETVNRFLKCKEKGNRNGRKKQITDLLTMSAWREGAGENQKTMKRLEERSIPSRLLGGLKSEGETEIEEPSEAKTGTGAQVQETPLHSSKARKRS